MRLKRITCFALILLICFPVNILAESGNSVSIRLKNLGTAMEGVRFDVYKVGTMDGYTPVIDSRFRINSFPREAYKLDNTARYISGMLSGNADSNGETDANGSLVFDGLADGVYLIRVSQSNDYGTISPFLVCLPYYENEKKCNSVEVEPKASNPNIEDTDTFIPEVQDKNTSTPSLVKTGDTTEFLSYISIFILSLIVFLSLLLQKRKKRREVMKRRIFAVLLSAALLTSTFIPTVGYGAFCEFEAGYDQNEIILDEQISNELVSDDMEMNAVLEYFPPETEFPNDIPFPEEPEIVPEAFESLENDINYDNLMSVNELKLLDNETVGATMEYVVPDQSDLQMKARTLTKNWSFDVYYVNQDNDYHVSKTSDFSLKYQFEFHTDIDLEVNTVNIRIPQVLFVDRYGKNILPTDIGVPQGIPDIFTPISNSPFNYYIEGTDFVFFNYRRILSGTNAAVQVLYKNLKALDIVDNTGWQLQPQASISISDNPEILQSAPLTGIVNTKAELAATSKTAMKETGKNYTPGLYTMNQLTQYLTDIPEKFRTNFTDYAYVLWQIKNTGTATQAWEMFLKEIPQCTYYKTTIPGEIVGISVRILDVSGRVCKQFPAIPITDGIYDGYYKISDYYSDFKNRTDIRLECYAVAAYPKEYIEDNITIFTNDVETILHPLDGFDEDIANTVSAQWTWQDYQWTYKGDNISIRKDTPQTDYIGWVDTYRQAAASGNDLGDFPFQVKSACRSYDYTHDTTGPTKGEYLNGTYCEIATSDDIVYAYPLTGANAGEKIMLNGNDYYFSDIFIEQTDVGYDVYEDRTAPPEPVEKTPGIDRGLLIYAMFENSNAWEMVDRVDWDGSGILSYVFPKKHLVRKPWRVKAVHNSVDYRTECNIELTLQIKQDSPVFKALLESGEENLQLRLENLDAVTGKAFSNENTEGIYFHDQSTDGDLYQEAGLIDVTQNLHGTIAMRDCRLINLDSLKKHAQAQKYAKAANDPKHERINIQYTVSAFEGYEIFSENALFYLKQMNLQAPSRNAAVFYDLLPYGVQFDPSEEIAAGRLTSISAASIRNPSLWDNNQITVSVDSRNDVIQNYRGTGRTLVKFHVQYEGDNPSLYDSGFWMAGYGISFSAYCHWNDIDAAEEAPNICAYMPENEDFAPVLGTAEEVAFDDGIIVPELNVSDYKYFGQDINEDGITDIRNVLYCRAMAFEDIAIASQSGIIKTVRADADRFGTFEKNTIVGSGDTYTYDIAVTNISRQPLKDIVIFDRLENAATDRRDEEPSMEFDTTWWFGSLENLDIEIPKELGIHPVIYYHENRNIAPIPSGETDARSILTETNGWYEAANWTKNISEVQAIAVDLSKKADGSEFYLGNMESVSFQIKMKAPENAADAIYAYNNPSFYSVYKGMTDDEDISQTVIGNSVKVQLDDKNTLEIIKEFTDDIPESRKDTDFQFQVTVKDETGQPIPYASKEYSLYFLQDNQWTKKDGIHATDAAGRLYLKSGQKAVFTDLAGASLLSVFEEENPFWEQAVTENMTETSRQLIFVNKYRPVLYLKKKVTGVPDDVDVSEDIFRFQITCGGKEVANKEFWYVDKAASYGTIPMKLGIGTTDENGVVSIHAGEIIALFPSAVGEEYQITELPDSYGDNTNWLAINTSETGTLTETGDLVIFENIYKWKDLYLTKTITHQKPEECDAEFSFKIWELPKEGTEPPEINGELLTGNQWELLSMDKKPLDPPISGTIGTDGILKCACGSKIIRIKNLEAQKTYLIQEINIPENYAVLNNGTAEVTMPVYAAGADSEITNDYLLRSLSVSKLVIPKGEIGDTSAPSPEEGISKLFTMKLSVKEEDDFFPKAGFPYRVEKNGQTIRADITDADGSFRIANSETAVFDYLGKEGLEYQVLEIPDAEYPPVYPAEGVPADGILEKEGSTLTMINGEAGSLVIQKKYVPAERDSLIEEALTNSDILHDEILTSGFVVEINQGNGWEILDSDVICVNHNTGAMRICHIGQDTPLLINGTETAVIQTIAEDMPFRVTELKEYQHRIIRDSIYTNSYISINQISPKNDEAVSGIIGIDSYALVINELSTFPIKSRIYKSMTEDSNAVPDGAELVLRVEQYNGTSWAPANHIRYLVISPQSDTSYGEIQTTGSDGLIRLYKEASGIPSVQFENTVYLNYESDMKNGDLRVVEVQSLSDDSFGYLIGYSSSKFINSSNNIPVPNLSIEDTDTFVNSNTMKPVEIEKKMVQNSSQTFTMILKPKNENAYGQSASGITYTLHDSETNEKLGEGKTTIQGEFHITAGQYARFYLPDGSNWTVLESAPYPYVLANTEGIGNSIEIRSDLSANILLQEQTEGLLTRDMVDLGVYDILTGERINLTKGDIIIPPEVSYKGQTVRLTGIDSYAFQGYSTLTGITLPDSMTIIKDYGFESCINLTNVILPDGLTSIGNSAFRSCFNLSDISIPQSVTSIGFSAFNTCRSLIDMILPPGISIISDSLFYNCSNLINVTMPDNITEISPSAFKGCLRLKDIVIPDTVTTISGYAFSGCKSLTSISIPDNVNTVGTSVFYNCSNLTHVKLPNNLTRLYPSTFAGCSSLTDISIPPKVTWIYDSAFRDCTSLKNVTIPDSVASIGESAFRNCKSLTSIILPDTLFQFGNFVFYDCIKLTDINIPGALTSLNYQLFFNCPRLTSLEIPNGVSRISRTFENCGLKHISLPASITNIDANAFTNCPDLAWIYIDQTEGSLPGAKWGANTECQILWKDGDAYVPPTDYVEEDENFYYTSQDNLSLTLSAPKNEHLETAIIPQSVNGKIITDIGYAAFSNCCNLADITIPDTITAIDAKAFENCSSLTNITLPDGINVLSASVFKNCSNLKTIILPANLSDIGDNAFNGCTSLTDITLPTGIKTIKNYAFNNCKNLTTLPIPDSVTTLGDYAFKGCTSLTELLLPPKITSIGKYVFSNCSSLSLVTIPHGVTRIGTFAFENCIALTDIILPESISVLNASAFLGCSSLTHIDLPDNVTTISTSLFEGCKSLTDISLSDKVTVISPSAFKDCSSLTVLSLPKGLTSLKDDVFWGCRSLIDIQIPDGITTISSGLFGDCSSLKKIVIPEHITNIGSFAFAGCSSLTEITIPQNVTSVGLYSFNLCRNLTKITIKQPKNSLSGVPWNAPNKSLIVNWTGIAK